MLANPEVVIERAGRNKVHSGRLFTSSCSPGIPGKGDRHVGVKLQSDHYPARKTGLCSPGLQLEPKPRRSLHTVCTRPASSLLQPLIRSSAESQPHHWLGILPPTLSCHPHHIPHLSSVFCLLGGPGRGRIPTLVGLHPRRAPRDLGNGASHVAGR